MKQYDTKPDTKPDLIFKHRNAGQGFTQTPNQTVRDQWLSLKARGLLIYITSYPAKWVWSREGLVRGANAKHAAIDTAIDELEARGYLRRFPYRRRKLFVVSDLSQSEAWWTERMADIAETLKNRDADYALASAVEKVEAEEAQWDAVRNLENPTQSVDECENPTG